MASSRAYSQSISTIVVLVIAASTIYILLLQYPTLFGRFTNAKSVSMSASSVETHANLQKAVSNKDSGYKASSLPGVDPASSVKIISSSVFPLLLEGATTSPRKRKMADLTKDPTSNSMQTLLNTWIEGSYSPVHLHDTYSEAFVVLAGDLAFFTFNADGSQISCTILSADTSNQNIDQVNSSKREAIPSPTSRNAAIVIEKGQYHALTAAPKSLGYAGYGVVFESSGRVFDPSISTKLLAPFSPVTDQGLNGDPAYFEKILKLCPHRH